MQKDEIYKRDQEVEKDQYEKINKLTARVEQLTGSVDVSNQINFELMKVIKKALFYMFLIIVFLIGAIIYGAIGKEGFYAVRPTFPTQAKYQQTDAIPLNDSQLNFGMKRGASAV